MWAAVFNIGAKLALRLYARHRMHEAREDARREIAKGWASLVRSIKVETTITSRFPQIQRAASRAMQEALDAAADTAVESAKRRVPVDTGRLKNSIQRTDVQRKRGGYTVAIYTDVPYARHVEYGTAYEAAHSFMRPAARVGGQRIAREFKRRFPKR